MGAGGSLAQLIRAGQWHSSAYMLYLALGVEEAQAIASILVEASESEWPERRGRRGREEAPYTPTRLGPEALS